MRRQSLVLVSFGDVLHGERLRIVIPLWMWAPEVVHRVEGRYGRPSAPAQV